MKRAAFITIPLAAVLILAAYRAHISTTAASHRHAGPPAPVIRSSIPLADVIRRRDVRSGTSYGLTPQVSVTCLRAKPRHKGSWDHVCRESYLAAFCIDGSTPEVDALFVDVLPRGFRTVLRRTLAGGACEGP